MNPKRFAATSTGTILGFLNLATLWGGSFVPILAGFVVLERDELLAVAEGVRSAATRALD